MTRYFSYILVRSLHGFLLGGGNYIRLSSELDVQLGVFLAQRFHSCSDDIPNSRQPSAHRLKRRGLLCCGGSHGVPQSHRIAGVRIVGAEQHPEQLGIAAFGTPRHHTPAQFRLLHCLL